MMIMREAMRVGIPAAVVLFVSFAKSDESVKRGRLLLEVIEEFRCIPKSG